MSRNTRTPHRNRDRHRKRREPLDVSTTRGDKRTGAQKLNILLLNPSICWVLYLDIPLKNAQSSHAALWEEIFNGHTFSSIGPVLVFGPTRSIKIIHLRLDSFSRNRFSASRIALIINLHSRSVFIESKL